MLGNSKTFAVRHQIRQFESLRHKFHEKRLVVFFGKRFFGIHGDREKDLPLGEYCMKKCFFKTSRGTNFLEFFLAGGGGEIFGLVGYAALFLHTHEKSRSGWSVPQPHETDTHTPWWRGL